MKQTSLKNILVVLSLVVLTATFKIDSTKSFLTEDNGRYKIWHGVNVVVKLSPFIPETEIFDPYTSFNDEDIAILKRLGINFVRLGITWESLEKEEGQYDMEHLEKMSDIVRKLEENGIDVLIDAHQDMFARAFCGEGAPMFYANKLDVEKQCKTNILSRIFKLLTACIPLEKHGWSYDEEGLPLIDDCKHKGNFMDYHRSPELTTIYSSFYKNQNGVLDAFAKFWQVLAEKFANRSNVIGYDIWNEPWPNDLWSDLRSLIPGYVDNHLVTDLYKTVDAAIEKVDNNYILFYQPVPFPDTLPLFGGKVLSTFSKPPVDPSTRPQVFNVHNYCCQAGPDICRSGEPSLKEATEHCPKFHEEKVAGNKKQAQKLNAPLIVTEFGACSDSEACYNEILGFVKAADNHMVSWAYWMYKPFNDHTTTAANNTEGIFNSDGTLQALKEKALSRTYIQAYQGYPLSFNFNDETKEAKAQFQFKKEITEPSILYINSKLNYPNGYYLTVTNEEGENINANVKEIEENYISIYVNDEEDGIKVNIKLVPK